MKMQKALILALGAGGVIAPMAVAQDREYPTVVIQSGNPTVFGDRAPATVYNNTVFNSAPCAAEGSTAAGDGGSYVMDDVSLQPGPFGTAYTGVRNLIGLDAYAVPTGWTGTPPHPQIPSTTTAGNITNVYALFEPGSYSASPMLSNLVPFATFSLAMNGCATGYINRFDYTIPAINLGTRTDFWVSVKATDAATGLRLPCGAYPVLVQPAGQTATGYAATLGWTGGTCIGSGTVDWARDQNPASALGDPSEFTGSPTGPLGSNVPNGAHDRRVTATRHGVAMRWVGDVIAGAPVPTGTACPLPAGPTVFPLALPSGAAQWYKLCLANPVTDATLTYLNIDTEGSGDDLSIALFDSSGALLATDSDSGDGFNAQISMGVGRAAAVGAGTQYDGRDGEITAAGDVYVAVAGMGAGFAGGFTVVGGTSAGAPSMLNVDSNVATPGVGLPALVPPAVDHFDFSAGFPIGFPAVDTLYGTTGAGLPNPGGDDSDDVLWSKFVVDVPGTTTLSGYIDVDFATSSSADGIVYIFNDLGDLIAYSDDQTPGVNFNPILSFGAIFPPRSIAAGQTRNAGNSPTTNWAGQNGDLAAGTYYMALAAWPADVLTGPGGAAPTFGAGRRFHARGLDGSNIDLVAEIYSALGGCDGVDWNLDTLTPDTLDIDDFLSVFSGGVCAGQLPTDPPCNGDIDFNNDGLFPDTQDINALLSVFSGGPCI